MPKEWSSRFSKKLRTHLRHINLYSYVNNNPLSYTDPTGRIHKKVKQALKRVTKWGERVGDQFKEQVARSTTYTLQKVSSVNYVGGLLSTGLLAGTQFGYAYGASTGDWRTVGRAHATGAVLAGGAWAAPGIAAMPWYSSLGASTALGYTSGYTIAQIYGASNAQASAAGQTGAQYAGYASLLYLGYQGVTESMTPTEKMNAENAVGYRRSPPTDPNIPVPPPIGLEEGSTTSKFLYDLKLPQIASGPHDWFTGSVGSGLRIPSNQLLVNLVDTPGIGLLYNVGTMPISAAWGAGALAAETGTTSLLIFSNEGYNPYVSTDR